MNKVKITDSSKEKIYNYIKKKFNRKFEKNSGNDSWSMTLNEFNKLISGFLQKYDADINLEKLVNYSSKEMNDLILSINKDQNNFSDKSDLNKVNFSKYFHELYMRLNNFLIIDALDIKVCLE